MKMEIPSIQTYEMPKRSSTHMKHKEDRLEINELNIQLKKLEKEWKIEPKESKRAEIINTRANMKELENESICKAQPDSLKR